MNTIRHNCFLVLLMVLTTFSSHAQGLISHDFDDGEMGPFVDCTTKKPNYVKVVNNRLRTYWKQSSYSSSSRMTKGAEACGDPVHNGVGYLTYKHCWMGFTMNIDKDYMQGDVGVGGLAQVFGFNHARSQSTWTAMLDIKDGDLCWMDRRGSGNTRAEVVVYEKFPRGIDMDIIIHNVLSGNKAGQVEIFVNGILKYSAYDINIGMGEFDENDTQTNESSTEFKIGQYNHSDAAENEIRIVDYDNISWYDGEDGYDIVNPNSSTSTDLIKGINEVAGSDVSICPNPVNDVLTVTNENQSFNSLIIVDALGMCVFTQELSGSVQELPVNHLSAGIYFVKFSGDSISKTLKIIKE